MIIQPRQVQFRTILAVAKTRPQLFRIAITFTFIWIPMALALSFILQQLDDDKSGVNYVGVMERGSNTKGIITEIVTQYNITINNQNPSIIHYNYYNGRDTVSTTFKTLAPDRVREMSVGDEIDVKYLAAQSIIPSLEPFVFPYWLFVIIPGVFFIVGIGPLLYLGYFVRNEILLYKYGKVFTAEVLSVNREIRSGFVRAAHATKVHYQYKGSTGRTHLGKSSTSDLSLFNSVKQGEAIKIFVSPEDESKSTLIPRLEAVRNNWQID